MNEPNPFEKVEIASEWIRSVEGEQWLVRDNEIYPRIFDWSRQFQEWATIVEIWSWQWVCSSKISSSVEYIWVEPSVPLTLRAIELYGENIRRSFRIWNAYSLPIEDNIVDGVLSVNVWFHLQNLNQAAYELKRTLKSKWKFLIITAHPESYNTFWEQQYTWATKDKNMITWKIDVPINPLSENTLFLHTMSELKESFLNQDLIIDKTYPMGNIWGIQAFIWIEWEKK